MAAIEIPTGIKPREFFCSFLPDTFNQRAAELDLSAYADIEVVLEFNVTGPEGGRFRVAFKEGKRLEVSESGAENALISVELPDSTFMEGLSGRIPEIPVHNLLALAGDPAIISLIDPAIVKGVIQAVQQVKGLMDVEAVQGGRKLALTVKFNGCDLPRFKISGDINELMALMMGKTDPVQGYMSAKFRIEGDLACAMSFQSMLLPAVSRVPAEIAQVMDQPG
jgi:hypothetical protein